MKTINVREKYLTYSGDTDYALRLNNEIRQAFAIAGMDMPKMLSDFLFSIEVQLQNVGVLDEDFNEVTE
jgi:hypothetical protein